MKLNQIFYGNEGFGYKVLGASDISLSEKAAKICRAVGTPDGISDTAPFLLSVPDGNELFMVCCSPGDADGVGRKTLFFHILVGNRQEATQAGINAFSLLEAKRFSDSRPGGNIAPVSVLKLFGESGVPAWDGSALRIPRKCPANSEIRKLVGSRVNDVAWATFSFCNLDAPFALYAVSEHVPLQAEKPMPPPQAGETGVAPSPSKKKRSGVLKTAAWFGLFTASVLLNVALLTKESQMTHKETTEGVDPGVNEGNPGTNAFAEGMQKGYQKALADLREKFPEEMRLSKLPPFAPKRVVAYVNFVNDNILNGPNQGE
ncbi:MAG: hypothetical protein IJN19_05730 [Opitutales bacterium]|nr:hypothetical protein [Opitutales bacterium]